MSLARLALAYHVTPAQLRECTNREIRAMRRALVELERAMKRKKGG